MDEKKYPVAEYFTSPQGEGVYTGTLMTFIRLAGCTVGKHLPAIGSMESTEPMKLVNFGKNVHIPIPLWQEKCTAYDGREFLCDTDFQKKMSLSVGVIMDVIPKGVEHLCLTGGEPLMHDIMPIVRAAHLKGMQVHVETSGTISLGRGLTYEEQVHASKIWLTVSPKFRALPGMLLRANEIKLLIDENFNEELVPGEVFVCPNVYIQPINGTHEVSKENLHRTLEVQRRHPTWIISLQLHKVMSEILQELVR